MTDSECVAFLQDVLPRLGLRWPGYRRVRRQVCKRLARRVRALGLADLEAYRGRLETDPAEWDILDSLCHITISRFCRDRGVWDALGDEILSGLAGRAVARPGRTVRAWSAGCASGEEPYSLALLWRFRIAPGWPEVALSVVATDADAQMIARARTGCYPPGALREVPQEWVSAAFEKSGRQLCLRPACRVGVAFRRQDLRRAMPDGPFDLVLCRNLAFTYFDAASRRSALRGIAERLDDGGCLVIGAHESLPAGEHGFTAEGMPRAIFRRRPRRAAVQSPVAEAGAAGWS